MRASNIIQPDLFEFNFGALAAKRIKCIVSHEDDPCIYAVCARAEISPRTAEDTLE
jgi:hypothetical protein